MTCETAILLFKVSTVTNCTVVRIMRQDDMANLICNFHVSVAVHDIVSADPSLVYGVRFAETLTNH